MILFLQLPASTTLKADTVIMATPMALLFKPTTAGESTVVPAAPPDSGPMDSMVVEEPPLTK